MAARMWQHKNTTKYYWAYVKINKVWGYTARAHSLNYHIASTQCRITEDIHSIYLFFSRRLQLFLHPEEVQLRIPI